MKKKIKIDITNFFGDSRSVTFDDIATAKKFVELYPQQLTKHQKVKLKCDALAIDGWVSGTL